MQKLRPTECISWRLPRSWGLPVTMACSLPSLLCSGTGLCNKGLIMNASWLAIKWGICSVLQAWQHTPIILALWSLKQEDGLVGLHVETLSSKKHALCDIGWLCFVCVKVGEVYSLRLQMSLPSVTYLLAQSAALELPEGGRVLL